MEINKMTLEQWREELEQRHDINKMYDPMCEEVSEYLVKTNLSLSSATLAAEFGITWQKMTKLLKCLVMQKRAACDPSIKRARQYWADPVYRKKTLEDKRAITAQEGVLNLKPTTLSSHDKKTLNMQIKRLQCYLAVDTLNKNHENHMLISLEETHVMLQFTPQKDKFDNIRRFLIYLDKFQWSV